jgi:hypothetical protein
MTVHIIEPVVIEGFVEPRARLVRLKASGAVPGLTNRPHLEAALDARQSLQETAPQ